MKNWGWISIGWMVCLTLTFLAGCGQADEQEETGMSMESGAMLQPIQVEPIVPETVKPGEEVELQAKVVQGDEEVNDAQAVDFEIQKGDQHGQGEMIPAELKGEGVYAAPYTFEEEGTYQVTFHVTARNMHNMPSKEVLVGAPNNGEQKEESHEENLHGTHEHEGEQVVLDFIKPDTLVPNQPVPLTLHAYKAQLPLAGANVKFEIWSDGMETHDYIEAPESKEGTYDATYTFQDPGTYHVVIHITNDEGLHEHHEERLEIHP